jgi:lipopolysaccharide transport system permease protein
VFRLAAANRHAPLFRSLVRREIRQRYKASAFGLLWTLINPAIMVTAYWFVFRFVFPTDTNQPYALFLFVGLATWAVFMAGAQAATSSLVANANLVTKVRFPREIVPLSAMTGQWFTAAAMFAIAIPLCMAFADGLHLAMLSVVPLLVLLCLLTVGFSLALAAINVYFRDAEHILAAVALPWFFLTPIFYSLDMVSPAAANEAWAIDVLHYGNFLSPFVLSIRGAMFDGVWPATGDIAYCVVAAGVFLVGGLIVFRRLEREMAVEL